MVLATGVANQVGNLAIYASNYRRSKCDGENLINI